MKTNYYITSKLESDYGRIEIWAGSYTAYIGKREIVRIRL